MGSALQHMPADGKIRVGTHDGSAHLWNIVIPVAACADGQIAMRSPRNQAVMAFKKMIHVP